MKKVSLQLLVALSLGNTIILPISNIETPLPGLYGFLHFPSQEYLEPCCDREDCWLPWAWTVNALGYARQANVAFPRCGSDDCTVPYAQLIFGVPSPFALSGIFFNSVIPANNTNPFLEIAQLDPHVAYREAGVIFNVTGEGCFELCDVPYRYGVTARLPVRFIDVINTCSVSDLVSVGGDIHELYLQRNEVFGDGTTNNPTKTNFVFAARLDFVSALNRIAIPAEPMVVYGDGTGANRTLIAAQDVGYPFPAGPVDVTNGNPCIAVIARADGTMPINDVWGDRTSDSQPVLAGNGTGVAQDARGRFSDAVDYATLSNDTVAQSKLFIVPTLKGVTGDSTNDMSTGALAIQSAINSALLSVPGSVFNFLDEAGLEFCDGHTEGAGDLFVELFLGRNWGCDDAWWTDVKFVVRFPTADRLCNCKQVFRQPTGNNHHYELMGGLAGGWDSHGCWKWMTDLTVAAALKENEIVAAPFTGSTVRNIGPCITARTNWWYLVFHTDLTVLACENCGFDVGYELYYKHGDTVCLCQNTAVDFLGNVQPLDPLLLQRATQRLANKARVALFAQCGNCEILGGWSYVVSGYNVPRDADWYISFTAYF